MPIIINDNLHLNCFKLHSHSSLLSASQSFKMLRKYDLKSHFNYMSCACDTPGKKSGAGYITFEQVIRLIKRYSDMFTIFCLE